MSGLCFDIEYEQANKDGSKWVFLERVKTFGSHPIREYILNETKLGYDILPATINPDTRELLNKLSAQDSDKKVTPIRIQTKVVYLSQIKTMIDEIQDRVERIVDDDENDDEAVELAGEVQDELIEALDGIKWITNYLFDKALNVTPFIDEAVRFIFYRL